MNSKKALRILSKCSNGEKKLVFTDSLDLKIIIEKDLDRLEQLKNLEEELGINLLTLFEAVKNGIIEAADLKYKQEYRTFPSIIWTNPTDNFKETEYEKNYEGFCLYDEHYGNYFYFIDYGKTWALTREELEHNEQ